MSLRIGLLTFLIASQAGAAVTSARSSVMAVAKIDEVGAASAAKRKHLQALGLVQAGDAKGALKLLREITAQTLPANEMDRVYLSIGRISYEVGEYGDALEAYDKVTKGGASWLEALEERATAQLRLGQPEMALASLKTVLTPLFENRIQSEPYFVTALAQLRICDYKSVFKTLDAFKDRYRGKIKTWESSPADPMARAKIAELRETIEKLNLVEAETIQRLYVDESGKRQAGAPPKIDRGTNQLTFPTDPESEAKEVWVDEVDDYKVTIKDCPTRTAAVPLADRKKE